MCVLYFLPAFIKKFVTFAWKTQNVRQNSVSLFAHLLYFGVLVLPEYPRIFNNLKKYDTQTLSFLSAIVLQQH